MPRLSKLDRMAVIQGVMEDADLSDIQSRLEEFAQAAQNAVEAMESIVQNAQTAQEAHEEREWEGRDDALSEIPDRLEELTEALDGLEELDMAWISELRGVLTTSREAADVVRDHADALIEA